MNIQRGTVLVVEDNLVQTLSIINLLQINGLNMLCAPGDAAFPRHALREQCAASLWAGNCTVHMRCSARV